MCSTQVGSSLSCKHKTMVKIVDSDKYGSLQLCGINYNRKMFYGAGPW